MSMDFSDVKVGDAVSSIVGASPQLSIGSGTTPNMEAMLRGGLQEAGVFVANAISRTVEFGMAATGAGAGAAHSVAEAGMNMANGLSQAMQTMINGLSTPKR